MYYFSFETVYGEQGASGEAWWNREEAALRRLLAVLMRELPRSTGSPTQVLSLCKLKTWVGDPVNRGSSRIKTASRRLKAASSPFHQASPPGAPNENTVQNYLNIALLNVFKRE